MKSAEIQDQINAIDAQIQAGSNDAQLNVWEMHKSDLKAQLSAALADEASQAERTQAQTAAVESITLPLDFNALFDNTAANDMIIEVVKEFQTQAYADHNAEVAKMNADWQDKIKAAADEANTALTQANATITQYQQQSNQLTLDKQDAEQKRDAAALEIEQNKQEIARLNSHIDDLQQKLANAPAPKAAIEIGSSDRLNELAAKAKESNADKLARALTRWNEAQPEMAVQPLDIPALPQVAEEPAAEATPQEIPAAIPGMAGHSDPAQVVGATTVTREEHEALKARVTALESGSTKAAA